MITLDLDFHRKVAQIKFLVKTREKCIKSDWVILLTVAYWCELHIQRIDKWHFKPLLNEVCKKENILRITTEETLHPNFSILMSLMKNDMKVFKDIPQKVKEDLV